MSVLITNCIYLIMFGCLFISNVNSENADDIFVNLEVEIMQNTPETLETEIMYDNQNNSETQEVYNETNSSENFPLEFYTESVDTQTMDDDQNNLETQTLGCGSYGDCLSTPVDCDSKCGCDVAYTYNETTEECQLNVTHLMKALLIIYDPVDPSTINDSGMAANIQRQSEKVFRGIIVAVIIFGICALVCVTSACFYCCRINYTDRGLKGNVKALAKKMHRDQTFKKAPKVPIKAEAQSCNVVVEDAGVFVC